MSQGYTAFILDQVSRKELLAAFPAKYARVVVHHITHEFDVGRDAVPEQPREIKVVGYHDNGHMQVLVAEVDGRKHQIGRPEDTAPRFYHITLSLDPASGAQTHHSNDVLARIVAEKGEAALRNLPEPMMIAAAPKFVVRLQPTSTPCDTAKAKIISFGR